MNAGPVHGKLGTYTNHGCRCDLCRAALRKYSRKMAARASLGTVPAWAHGTTTGYQYGCRCDPCRVENSRRRLARREARP